MAEPGREKTLQFAVAYKLLLRAAMTMRYWSRADFLEYDKSSALGIERSLVDKRRG